MSKKVTLVDVEITDYKNIKSLSKKIEGRHFIAFGRNGQGKTSLFECINRMAVRIDPKDMADVPIRMGAKSSRMNCIYQVEEDGAIRRILVENVITPKTKSMTVVDMDTNEELKPAIETLQKIIGENHDVSPLVEMAGDDQFKYLIKILGGSCAIQNIECEYKKKYTRRKGINADIKRSEALRSQLPVTHEMILDSRVKGMYLEPKPIPEKPENTIELDRIKAERQNDRVKQATDRKADIQQKIDLYRKMLADQEALLVVADEWLAQPENQPVDMATFDTKKIEFARQLQQHVTVVKEVEEYNETCKAVSAYTAMGKELDDLYTSKRQIEADMDADKKAIADALVALNLQTIVPELEIKNEYDEDEERFVKGIFYGGLPFNRRQISYGKMIVALAKLSSYVNCGKFNLFHIKAWNDLDQYSQRDILEFAKNNPDLNVQFGIEEVSSNLLGIRLIEDVRFQMPEKIK